MILGAVQPSSLAGVILNDIGPDIPGASTDRIAGYVGNSDPFPDWDAAIMALKTTYGIACPDLDDAGWRKMAETTFTLDHAQRPASTTTLRSQKRSTVRLERVPPGYGIFLER